MSVELDAVSVRVSCCAGFLNDGYDTVYSESLLSPFWVYNSQNWTMMMK